MFTLFVGHIATLLVRFTLAHKNELPHGWAPRILIQCGVPFVEIWDVFHEMYESQVLLFFADSLNFTSLTVPAGTTVQ